MNTDRARDLPTSITIKGASIAARAGVETIQAGKPGAFNHFATPEAIASRSTQIDSGNHFELELPAGSVSVVVLDIVP